MRKALALVAVAVSLSLGLAPAAEARKRLNTYVDKNGTRRVTKSHKIYRDYAAINEFKRTHPKPNDGHAYDIHHITPLKDGGADKPSNMEWIRTETHRKNRLHR